MPLTAPASTSAPRALAMITIPRRLPTMTAPTPIKHAIGLTANSATRIGLISASAALVIPPSPLELQFNLSGVGAADRVADDLHGLAPAETERHE